MSNVNTDTPRELVILEGNRGPRNTEDSSESKSTSEVLRRIRDQLLDVGPIREDKMRREVLAISRQRHYRLRRLLVAQKFVQVVGRPLVWSALPILPSLNMGSLEIAWEPQRCRSNTKRGALQVNCTLCGLFSRTWDSEADAREWYFSIHVHEGVAHK